MTSPAIKQLKKNDFLSVITETPMTRGQLVEALDEYNFIPTYLDFLIDHFVAQKKLVITDGEIAGSIMIARKGKKTGGPRSVFRVLSTVTGGDDDEEIVEHKVESKEITGNMSPEDKHYGWSMTRKSAIKKACSDVFADYKAKTAAIKELDVEDSAPAEKTEDEKCDPA